MASPEEIAQLLPETLPEDFSEWDSGGSPTAKPVQSSEWEAWEAAHPAKETAKAAGQSTERKTILSSAVERPHDTRRISSAPVFINQQKNFSDGAREALPKAKPVNSHEWEAWEATHSFGKTPKPLGQSPERKTILTPVAEMPRVSDPASSAAVLVTQQESTSEPVDGSPSRASQVLETGDTTDEAPVAAGLPDVATADGMTNSPESAATLKIGADEALFDLFSSKNIEVKQEPKTAKKKWMIVAGVSTCAILLPLILMMPLFHHGTKTVAKQSVQPLPEASDTQQATEAPNPSANEPLTEVKPLATTEKQQATDDLQSNEKNGAGSAQAPTKMQAKMMDEQLTAPTQIPQGIEKQAAEDAPPPVSLTAAGADGLGGSGSNASVFNGHAQPVVKVAPSKPIVISSGVAIGMLIQKTPPVYPPIAKSARVSGTVELHATIAKNGTIKDLHVVNGPTMLQQSAIDAVRTWRYKPYKLNNEPTEVETTINVVFTLAG